MFKSASLFAGLVGLLVSAAACAAQGPPPGETEITFEADSGETVAAFEGRFEGPENRADPDSRMIELGYVRFPATGEDPGAPIVYLAGGPGGSGTGTARGRRFPLFMAMREHGDVIAFDQRGTGLSEAPERCRSSVIVPAAEPVSDADFAELQRAAVEECGGVWRDEGVDLAGWDTRDSVADLSALRRHLRAERISLWGISYGTHLALAAMKDIEPELDRVILASAEGLDQTVKLPARTDAYFARLQAAVDTQPAAAEAYSDIAGLMRRVHARLEVEPVLLSLPQEDGEPIDFLLQRHTMQQAASALVSDPQSAALLLSIYREVDAGEYDRLAGLLARYLEPGEPITLRAMPTSMDLASGVSPARLEQFEAQAPEGLVGAYLNFPMPQILGVWPGHDLGAEFREAPVSDVPVLLLTGTLDGRTYTEGQAEAVRGLTDVHQVMVVNAGHNLFMTSPEVGYVMSAFMRGEAELPGEIVVDLPEFAPGG